MGYLTYFALFICIALSYDTVSARRLLKPDENGRIAGGTEVSIDDFPYMASLTMDKGSEKSQCGGSIISRRYILTAAHCLNRARRVTVRIGSTFASSGGTVYKSIFTKMHPLFHPVTYDYDVGLIRVPRMNLVSNNASIVPLIKGGRMIPKGTLVNITGWGATSKADGNRGFPTLLGATISTYSNEKCAELLNPVSVTDNMFCAGVDDGSKDTCEGDSGGAAVSGGIQIGIVSSGVGCASPYYPGVYTNITNRPIRWWISFHSRV